jgi:glycosyltransferase involved in cell wall biosynthesis
MLDVIHLYMTSFAGGGAERIFIRLANHFAQTGIRTRFIVNEPSGPLRGLLSEQVELIELGAPRVRHALRPLTCFMAREQPRVVISGMTFNNLAALAARAASRSQTKLIICERNQLSNALSKAGWLRRQLVLKMIQTLYPRADAITAVSGGVAEDVARLSGISLQRIAVVQNPPPEPNEIADARNAEIPHHWFAEQPPVVVAIGRLVRQKAYAVLLRALAQVRQTIPARLIILGDGPERDDLAALARDLGIDDAVAFEGFVLNRLDYLVRASVYALSSEYEGYPNALIEAIACGIPVVSTDCAGGGPREILSPSLEEALVPTNDVDGLAQALIAQLRAPVNPERLSRIARRFSLDTIADRYLRLAAT